MAPVLWLVIPCYNEEEILEHTARVLGKALEGLLQEKKIAPKSRILFVNDGSKDHTWDKIMACHKEWSWVSGLNLTRNCGHQNALLAGLMTAKEYADVTISLDADLQDDSSVLGQFLEEYEKGNDIVYGVRSSRRCDSTFKRLTAQGFYQVLRFLGVETVYNHADYRLMSKRALEGLSQFDEVNLYLRGIVLQIGYPSSVVEYERKPRMAGESKYPLKKMIKLAFNGITSFSIRPIQCISALGMIMFTICMVMILYFLVRHFTGNTVSGWTSLIISIWTLGSLQLIAIGVIGEYIGKTYIECKHRPKYLVQDFFHEE